MSKSITQDMAYRQSLMKYAEKYGVSRASRKYNKSRSYIYFWKQRWDGSVASLACQSRRPHSHPNQHTEAELKLIRDMRRRNPTLGMVELWHRLRQRGYTRCPESLFRVMRKIGLFPRGTTVRWSAATVRTRNAFIPATHSILWTTLQSSLPKKPRRVRGPQAANKV